MPPKFVFIKEMLGPVDGIPRDRERLSQTWDAMTTLQAMSGVYLLHPNCAAALFSALPEGFLQSDNRVDHKANRQDMQPVH